MRHCFQHIAIVALSWICMAGVSMGQVRLIGITGNLFGSGDAGVPSDDPPETPDETLFEISLVDASTTELMRLTHIPDSDAIGYNPVDGLIYHVSGAEAWSASNPARNGFRDNQYMETVNLATGELNAIFNANPPESPDDFPAFGLPAPRPDWVLPEEVSLIDDPLPGERGEDEYHALRDLTWSKSEGLFYGTDENGIFKLTPSGQSTFLEIPDVDRPRDIKAISFAEIGGETKLLMGGKKDSLLWTVDPATGFVIGQAVELLAPPGGGDGDGDDPDAFGGLLALDQHPQTGALYGVRKTADTLSRELVIIDPATGETELVGNLGLQMASIAFVGSSVVGDFNQNGILDADDIDILSGEVRAGTNDPAYDLNGDTLVNQDDREVWVDDLKRTYFGDANLDGEFNSADFVEVFQRQQYEDGVPNNSGWADGDWNGDTEFDSADFVVAFQAQGYEAGPRLGAAAVPEPSAGLLLLLGLIGMSCRRKN